MWRKEYKSYMVSVAMSLILLLLFQGTPFAQKTTADFKVDVDLNPNKTVFTVGSIKEFELKVDMSGYAETFTYQWTLKGPGTLDGISTEPSIFYIPPDEIEETATVSITIVVSNTAEQANSDSIPFTILPKEGMSTSTKVVIGIVGAAALGGGGALIFSSSDDGESESPEPSVEITSHSDNSQINRIEHVFGTAEGFDSGDYVSIVVYSDGDGTSYPHYDPGPIDNNGNWSVGNCYFGREGDLDVGANYEIQAFLKDGESHETKATAIVKVTRK